MIARVIFIVSPKKYKKILFCIRSHHSDDFHMDYPHSIDDVPYLWTSSPCIFHRFLPQKPKIWVGSLKVVPPSYKLVYNPINYRYITYKP